MNSDKIAIQVRNLSKLYRIGLKENMHDTFAGSAFEFLKNPLKNYRKYRSLYNFKDIQSDNLANNNTNPPDVVWAVKDVSFEVYQGEVLGIIGKNGAGKSTLLKILCKITDPHSGYAKIYGRISSLLEVGTGFHKELTGRENIYLNGCILGMKKSEIDRNFDKIVAFSEIGKFIDTPVKRYSSGMTVRLAFSVAAHLEPEILIIDEVLAVGDIGFQRKCIEKMEDVSKQGRTVLFVSHNMASVSRLCSRALLIDNGTIVKNGPTDHVVNEYLQSEQGTSASKEWHDSLDAPCGDAVRLIHIKVLSSEDNITEYIDIREPIKIQMQYEVFKPGRILLPHLYFWNSAEICVFGSLANETEWKGEIRPVGTYISSVTVPGNLLANGIYYVNAVIASLNPFTVQFYERNIVSFYVNDRAGADTARGDWTGEFAGIVRPLLQWRTEKIS